MCLTECGLELSDLPVLVDKIGVFICKIHLIHTQARRLQEANHHTSAIALDCVGCESRGM